MAGRSTWSLAVMKPDLPRLAVIVCSIALAERVQACDCSPPKLGVGGAALAFVGIPTSRTEWARRNTDDDGYYSEIIYYSFSVERTLKGPKLERVVVGTSRSDCGIPFQIGRRYRVVARTHPELGIQWTTDQCTQTRLEK